MWDVSWDVVVFSSVLSNWQLFFSHVEIPNLGNIYAWSKIQTAIIKTSHKISIFSYSRGVFSARLNPIIGHKQQHTAVIGLWGSGKAAWGWGAAASGCRASSRWHLAAHVSAWIGGRHACKGRQNPAGILITARGAAKLMLPVRGKSKLFKCISTLVTLKLIDGHYIPPVDCKIMKLFSEQSKYFL